MKLFVICTLVAAAYSLPLDGEGVPTINVSALDSRIYNGYEATLGQFPWQAVLYMYSNSDYPYGLCGGSLIHTQWVLTAAHNFNDNGHEATFVAMWFGIIDITNTTESVFRYSYEYYIYPHFDDDIGLIKLNEIVTNTANVRAIDLGYDLHSGSNVKVSGFGRTEDGPINSKLYYAELTTMTNEDCRTVHRYNASVSQVCASSETQSTCRGDSGSPLVMQENGVWKQFGVYNGRLDTFCRLGIAVFSRISYYRDWILETIESHQ